MGDAEATATAEGTEPTARRGPWVWIFLALWLIWLVAMIAMSASEWGKPKPSHVPDDPPMKTGTGRGVQP